MPTGEETGFADGMLRCCAWYAQEGGGTMEFGGGYTAVYAECGTHNARLRNTKARLGDTIVYWF